MNQRMRTPATLLSSLRGGFGRGGPEGHLRDALILLHALLLPKGPSHRAVRWASFLA